MKTFLFVLVAVVMTILVCIPIHFSLSKHIRTDRFKTMQYLDAAYEELHFYKGKFADKNRVGGSPKYRMLMHKIKVDGRDVN